jgi:hypothetical protein
VHHCFRAIPHANAVAFQSRLKAAMTAAGIDMALQFRHLFVIRRDATPGGPKTKQLCKDFNDAGGMFVSLTDEDLKTILAVPFTALKITEKDGRRYLVMDTTKDALEKAPGYAFDRSKHQWLPATEG